MAKVVTLMERLPVADSFLNSDLLRRTSLSKQIFAIVADSNGVEGQFDESAGAQTSCPRHASVELIAIARGTRPLKCWKQQERTDLIQDQP
jgi:hypothetical protein